MIIFIEKTSFQIYCNHNTATLYYDCNKLKEFKFNDNKELKKQIENFAKILLHKQVNTLRYLYKNHNMRFIHRIEHRSPDFREFCDSFEDYTDCKKLLKYANSNDTNF